MRDNISVISINAGQQLFKKGDEPKGIYEILEGRIKLSSCSTGGKEITLGIYEAPTTLSDTAVCAMRPHVHNAIAVSKSRVGFLPLSELNELREKHREIDKQLLLLTSRRMQWLYRSYEAYTILELEARLAGRLHSYATRAGEKHQDQDQNEVFSVRVRQDDLANMLGASRQSVNKLLKDWESAGIIELTYGLILLKKPAVLLEIVAKEL